MGCREAKAMGEAGARQKQRLENLSHGGFLPNVFSGILGGEGGGQILGDKK